ncbi:hypothetical protein QTO34_008300 [Cnephaeus nilssonii]|uniref:C-X-C motif chemokine n=1 Tax=Cnephaeus nilssonii TaxID=3371016 RepID=A0AA40IA89_CNENI|nr:hypothetical protein QTO34_008300 [Eptesicus nilssonii]
MDKRGSSASGSHRPRSTSSPASSHTPGTAAPILRAQPHGPHRHRRCCTPRSPVPPGRAPAPAPGRRLPASCSLWSLQRAPKVTELRCQCLQIFEGIHPKIIQSVQVTSPGPHCDQTEVIATLKNGQKVCLNPASPLVKKILDSC